MKNVFIVAVAIASLVIFIVSSQNFPIVKGVDFNDVDRDYWLCFGQNATIVNGYAILEVNDTLGKWSYSKVQQGILPHGWTQKGTIAEVKVTNLFEANENVMFLRLIASRSEFKFYNSSESWVNFGIGLWFKVDGDFDKDPSPNNGKQLVIDIRPVSMHMYNGNVEFYTEDVGFVGSGNPDWDYHYLVTTNPFMIESNRFYDITVDVGGIVKRAFNHYGIKEAQLKCVEIYVEAYYGYGKATVDFADFRFQPKMTSKYSLLYGFIAGLSTMIVLPVVLQLRKFL